MKLEIVQAVKAHPLSSLKNPVTLLFLGLAFFSPHSEASSAQIIATNAHGSEKFQSEQAQFGPTFNVYGYSGLLLLSQPVNACSEIDPAPDYSVEDYAYFVLIEQGECDFEDKVLIAQAAGFDGVIVYNALDDTLKSMGSNGAGDVSIPSTFVGKSDGLNLRANYTWNHNAIYYNAKVVVKGEFLIPLKCYLIPFVVIVGVCFCIMLLFVLFKLVRDHRARLKNRLSRRGLKKLPTRKWKKGDPDCIDWESCAICLEDYEDGHKLRVLPCKHAFHCKCIDPWLTETRRVCPLCKQRITPRGELEEPSPPPTPHAAHNPEEGEGGMEGENTSEGGESDDALLGGNEHNRERSVSNSRFNHDTRRQTPSRLSSQRRNASLESGSITQDLINSHHLEPDYVDDESSDDSSNFETSERPQVNLRRSRQRRSLDAPSATSDPESNDSNVERRTRLSKVIGFFSGRRGTRSGSGVESESGSSNVQGTEDDTRVGRALGSNQLQVYENDVGFILQSEDVNDIVGDGNRDHTDVSSTTSSSMSAAVSFTESVPRNGQNPKRSQQDTNEKSLDSDSMSKCESSSKGVSTSGRKDTSSTPTAADLFRTDSSNQNDRDPPASPRENQFRDDVALLKDF